MIEKFEVDATFFIDDISNFELMNVITDVSYGIWERDEESPSFQIICDRDFFLLFVSREGTAAKHDLLVFS